METRKLDFEMDDDEDFPIVVDTDSCLNPNWAIYKLKQLCQAVDAINDRLDNIENRVDGLDARLPHPLIGNLDKLLDKIGNRQCDHEWQYGLMDGAICNKCGEVKHG